MHNRIALVSDFYYPFVGGVEMHIKQLALLLTASGHHVIVITHKRKGGYVGLRDDHGFPVYYLNIHYHSNYMFSYPTFMFNFPEAKRILQEQRIDIVHCHQTSSFLSLEYIFFATLLGKRIILTEHSLVGMKSVIDILFNRLCQVLIPLCTKVVAVSRTTRNNLIIRTKAQQLNKFVVVPNGVCDVSHVRREREPKDKVRIVTIGRLAYRRGTDLLIHILPKLCANHPGVEVFVIGDGVKRRALEKCIEINEIGQQVKVLGVISDHEELLNKVGQCDIFLNTPLTESFGIALAEAALLGLHCVSTNVGGVEEAIPRHLLSTSPPEPTLLLNVLSMVIEQQKSGRLGKGEQEQKFQTGFGYRWQDVASRTVEIYEEALKQENKFDCKQYIMQQIRNGNVLEFLFVFIGLILIMVFKVADSIRS